MTLVQMTGDNTWQDSIIGRIEQITREYKWQESKMKNAQVRRITFQNSTIYKIS